LQARSGWLEWHKTNFRYRAPTLFLSLLINHLSVFVRFVIITIPTLRLFYQSDICPKYLITAHQHPHFSMKFCQDLH
jgi:hypothetical protein